MPVAEDSGVIKMLSRKSRRSLCKFLGCLIIIFVVYTAFKLTPDVSHSPVEFVNILQKINTLNSGRNILRKQTEKFSKCKSPHLMHPAATWNSSQDPACRRVQPVPDSCDVAESLFSYAPNTCDKENQINVCSIKKGHEVTCDKGHCSGLQLGLRSIETGELQWTDVLSEKKLEIEISRLLHSENNGYCYIRCEQESSDASDQQQYYDQIFDNQFTEFGNVQLLLLPPSVKVKGKEKDVRSHVNVNLIFIDSVSRHHFYRSMQRTINLFNKLNLGKDVSVFDFELLQALRSRTFETLNSLLGGFVPSSDKTFGILDMPPEPLKIEGLFGPFEDAGYSTLWLEDLCFEWEWGISKDLCVHNKSLSVEETWEKLNTAFRKARIGSFGMSTANCEILAASGVNDHFHGPDTMCFNGRHQHEYLLEYLTLYQKRMTDLNNPFLTFLETNVAHEDTGRRIQTIDEHLEQYLKFAIKSENTLTIVFSDHGNTYGKFLEKSSEGRVEIYHPTLFMIIPKRLSEILGKDKMSALTVNQHRLVSHLDLHYTLKSLVQDTNIPASQSQYQLTQKGLFEAIPTSRQCSQVPQIPPNFCICEGGESRLSNSSHYVVYAHFAVGSLNNAIQNQFQKSHPTAVTGFGNCQRPELVSFQHVRKTVNVDQSVRLTMDLMFQSGDPSYSSYEVFMVSLHVEKNGHISLAQSDRLSPYKKYEVCADSGVQLQLCVCNVTNKTPAGTNLPLSDLSVTSSALLMEGKSSVIEASENCLLQINQQSKEGFTLSLMNVCTGKIVHATLTVRSENTDLSTDNIQQLSLRPGDLRFVLAGVVSDGKSEWGASFHVEVGLTKWS